MSEREKFEAALIAGNPKALTTRFLSNPEQYANLYVQSTWEGWQMRSKAGLSADQMAAIEVSLVYLHDKFIESASVCPGTSIEDAALWANNTTALGRHIETLRAMLPAPSQEQEAE